MKKLGKISGGIFLFLSILLMGYLSINLEDKNNFKVGVIELNGDNHLTKDQYFKFANFDKQKEYPKLTLPLIRDRLEKHPYVESAEVRYQGKNKVTVNLFEKDIEAILMIDSKQYFITKELELIPFLPFTRKVNYPVISNPRIENDLQNFKSVKKSSDIITGLKILTTIKLVNPELYENISEVDLRKGKDIVMSFSSLEYPIVIGRNNEIKKTIYFSTLWNHLKGKKANDYMDYVDLRFNKHVYLGLTTAPEEKGTEL